MSSCATCGNLADHVAADLEAGEALPPEVSKLEAIAGSNARRCPTCGALFLYTYDYEYGALGDGWEDATLDRVDRDRVVAVLLASPPSSAVNAALAELGVADGEALIMAKLRADLDDPAASYEALRKLVPGFLGTSDLAAIDRLLHHPRAKVRSDTLYLLQTYRGSLVFRAVAATNDPSPAVREATTTAAFVDPPRDVGLEPMITACLADPDEGVRSNAAWTLAVFAEDKRDVSASLPALAARVTEDPSLKVRTTAARALVGAASAGAKCSAIVSVVERLDPTDALRTRVLDAIRAQALHTRSVRLWRCPTCGSTDAGPDEPRSAYELTYMQCNGCGEGGLVDSWERDSDWIAEVVVRSKELPSHVPPLAPGEGFYETMQAAIPESTASSVEPSESPSPPSLAPSIPTSAKPEPKTASRDTPGSWLLGAAEVAALWALEVPLDAACVPDDELRLAIASRRVKRACSFSSMGTAETYWALAEPIDNFAKVCRDGVVVPPGETAQETPYEDRADDRDVDGVLWAPFFREQRAALARSVPQELRLRVVAAYARILADLEERWAKGPKLVERAPFVEWLRTDGPVDEAELERWLVEHNKRSVGHLVQGIRARWLTHDVATAFSAVMTSVERIKADPELQRATRIELLRRAARVVRAR